MRAGSDQDVFDTLRSLLREDRAAGIEFDDGDFANTLRLVCEATRARHWFDPIVETANAWRKAYLNEPGAIAHFGAELLVDAVPH